MMRHRAALRLSLSMLALCLVLNHAAAAAHSKQQVSVAEAEAAVPQHSTVQDLKALDTSFSRMLAKAFAHSSDDQQQQRVHVASVASVKAAAAASATTAARPAQEDYETAELFGYKKPKLGDWLEGLVSDLEEEAEAHKHKVHRSTQIEYDDTGRKGFYDDKGHFIVLEDKHPEYEPHSDKEQDSEQYSPRRHERYTRRYYGQEEEDENQEEQYEDRSGRYRQARRYYEGPEGDEEHQVGSGNVLHQLRRR